MHKVRPKGKRSLMEILLFRALNVGHLIGILGVIIGIFGMAFGNWFFGRFLFKRLVWRSDWMFHFSLLACLMIPFIITVIAAVEVMLRIYLYFL